MYPPLHPYETKMVHVDTLKNGDPVKLYVEFSGNPQGIPVIYCHGGPGDQSTPYIRQLYNPKQYNIILYDQRGCGKSLPRGHLEKNTTQDLLKDMEKIRTLLGVERWVVSGGSWGSSLALLYAQKYTPRVLALLLRGVYDLSQKSCVDNLFPEQYHEINKIIQYRKGTNRFKRILKVLQTRKSKRLVSLLLDLKPMYVKTPQQKNAGVYSSALVNAHYEASHYFISQQSIYKNMHKIKHIPTWMVNGRWDIVTPTHIAYTLSQQMNHCTLHIVDAGHTAKETAIGKKLTECSDILSKKLANKD